MGRRWLLTGCAAPAAVLGLSLAAWPVWLRLLLAAVPVLWLAVQGYRYWLRILEERRIWRELATAPHRLLRLDEREVVDAALHSLGRLFAPERVEIAIRAGGGTERVYASGQPGPRGRGFSRQLRVGDHRIGELRLWLRTPGPMSEREDLALSAYAGTLGAALLNVAAHRRLRELIDVLHHTGDPGHGKGLSGPERVTMLAELRQALLVEDQLVLALQPAVELATGAPIGAEALVRWQHPSRGLLAPDAFIEVVEHSDLVGPFSRYILDLALRITSEWAASGLIVPVAVNLSARNLLEPDLPGVVAESLRRHGVPAGMLVLEITETVMLDESPIIDQVLAGLRELGVRIAVDDFGTGYSSLTLLTRFQVDEVKVDRAFVSKMGVSPEAAAIVKTTVDLGRALGLRVVAEGVETAEQRQALIGMGCTAAQGYHFSPPLFPDKAGVALATLARAAGA
nr:EAL domain-containing protein [Longispora albida]